MSGPIPEGTLEEILSRTDIVEIIGEYVQLRKAGNGYQGLCPFHTDSQPSFHVNPARQFFHCFGCGAGGNAFHFLMKQDHLTFPDAVRTLATRVGVELPERPLSPGEKKQRDVRRTLLEINETAADYFREVLKSAKGKDAARYLRRRGISPEAEETFQLGYAPPGWRGLLDHLRKKGVSEALAEQAGLIIRGKEGNYYDRFRGRVIFPIRDERSRVIGFGGRTLGDDLPKYLNSPDSPVFSKGKNLYGLHAARKSIHDSDSVVLVEGYTDVLALYQFGIENVVATLGTALTVDHLRMLKRYTDHALHVFDADAAGVRATLRALDLCLEANVWGRVLRLPEGRDPDSYVREIGSEAFKQALKESIPLMDFQIDNAVAGQDITGAEGKRKALDLILPHLRKMSDEVVKDHYITTVSERLGIAERHIHKEFAVAAKASQTRKREREEKEAESACPAERLLLKAILTEPALVKCLFEEGILEAFTDPNARSLGELMTQWGENNGSPELRALEARVQDPELAKFLTSLLTTPEEVTDPERICEDCLKTLKIRTLERELQDLKRQIATAREKQDSNKVKDLEQRKGTLVVRKAMLRMSA